jgi:hypothetical protein
VHISGAMVHFRSLGCGGCIYGIPPVYPKELPISSAVM